MLSQGPAQAHTLEGLEDDIDLDSLDLFGEGGGEGDDCAAVDVEGDETQVAEAQAVEQQQVVQDAVYALLCTMCRGEKHVVWS